ncbi:signal transduction histidine kinase VraS [Staphylococcus aureus]|uniref:Signal transduction histidine kinase VraS n=1 Tax=Staphylococcus aureus TaxID=1280 RepID=A0A380ELZ9_STAAU|nr:signal transduction histidine kinase VraS [Staphylococcus aureus]
MNHYIRTIGSMLILVYSMLAAFLFIDKVFVNIIYFQGMFLYTNIRNTSFFIFKSHHHIIVYYCWFGTRLQNQSAK